MALVEPLAKQLKLKKAKMEDVLKAYAVAADYGVADVTTAATFHTAALYQDFGKALMTSQRPKKLTKAELEQYNVLLEEQAFPFEEKAIELHEVNARRAADGIYDQWVQEQLHRAARAAPGALRQDRTRRRSDRCDPLNAVAAALALLALGWPLAAAPAWAAAVAHQRRKASRDGCSHAAPRTRSTARRRPPGSAGRRRRSARRRQPAAVTVPSPVPPAAQRAFDDARRALRAGRTDEAERGFRGAGAVQPRARRPACQPGPDLPPAPASSTEAVAALERRCKASPKQPVYFNQLGIAYRQQGQFDKAREAYEHAIALDAGLRRAACSTSASCTTCTWATARGAGAVRALPGAARPAATPR